MEKTVADKLFEQRRGKERRDSIGCLEEMWKKKRGEMDKSVGEEEEAFKRSKLIERSTIKSAGKRKEGQEG